MSNLFAPKDLVQRYVSLTANGVAKPTAGGEAFWLQSHETLEQYGRDWLVTEYRFEGDWTNWEMHPEGDELVYVVDGSVDLILEFAAGTQTFAIRGQGYVVVPKGIWHTAKVLAPSRVLHITRGVGTQHRPVG
jgi:mannose-6-phosphate isomerase-like protein (cupin superfamily)